MTTYTHHRQGFIGGSDCYRIMNGEWYELWLEKTGRALPDDLSDIFAVRLGTATEEFHIQEIERDSGLNIGSITRQYQHERTVDHVPCRATLDGVQGAVGYEVKHTHERNTMRTQLDRYMPQLQFYMQVTGIKRMYFSCIFGNRKREQVMVEHLPWYCNELFDQIIAFWDHVKSDTQPEQGFIDTPRISIDNVPVDSMIAVDMSSSNEFANYAQDYVQHAAASKSFETAKKTLKGMMPTNCRELYNDTLALRRSANGSVRFVVKQEVEHAN